MPSMSGWIEANFRARKRIAHLVLFGFCALLPAVAQETPDPASSSGRNKADPVSSDASAGSQTPPSDYKIMGLRPVPLASISHQLSFDDRVRLYRGTVFSPTTLTSPALGAAIDQWQDEPTEWGQGMAGYARRFGSGVGRNLANKTLIFGVSALDGEDPRYFASDSPAIRARAGHAVASAFLSYTEDGSRMPAYAHFAGAYGSSFIAMTWYPRSKSSAQHALAQGTTKLAMNAGMNVLREFWPDLKRRLHFGR